MHYLKSLFTHTHISMAPIAIGGIFVLFLWFLFLLTLLNIFIPSFVFLGAGISILSLVLIGKKMLFHTSLEMRLVILFSLVFTFLIGMYTVPTIFSGRDQGSISEASFRLAQNNKLIFSTPTSHTFFALHEQGLAQNFPGFAYTQTGELVTQFPLGYISWLAGCITLFGEKGFIINNTVLLFLSMIFFYALIRKFTHPFYASLGLILFSTSFLFVWFTKITLSENLALFLFLFLCYSLISFIEKGTLLSYATTLLTTSLLVFTRIEGFAILSVVCFILFLQKNTRSIIRRYFWRSFLLPASFFIVILIIDFNVNLPYYTMIGKALFKFLHITESASFSPSMTNVSPSLWSIFFLYGLGIIFILGLTSILFFIKEKKWILLLPAFLAFPTFIYLVDPNISPDHPWMLRRFFFSVFPALLFSAIIGIASLFSSKKHLPFELPKGKLFFVLILSFFILFIAQYPAFIFGFSFAENQDLKKQVLATSQMFLDTDLVLVARDVTGNGFSMMTGTASYLTQKNVVYFFNPNDLSLLDTTPYTNVYLIVPEKDQMRYTLPFGHRLSFQKTLIFKTNQLENPIIQSTIFPSFPKKIIKETRNSLFLFQ